MFTLPEINFIHASYYNIIMVRKFILLMGICICILSACLPVSTQSSAEAAVLASTVEAFNTQAAVIYQSMTRQAEIEQTASVSLDGVTPRLTSTPRPDFPTETPVVIPTTAVPTPIPSRTPTTNPAYAGAPCLLAGLVKENVKDGTKFNAGMRFVKYWQIINKGSCTWTKNFSFVFTSGDPMSGPSSVPLEKDVPPGESIDIAVTFFATIEKGKHVGYWMLQDDKGQKFGYGPGADGNFWILIYSDPYGEEGTNRAFDFTQYPCSATYSSSVKDSLPCQMTADPETGYHYVMDSPVIEGKLKRKNLKALIFVPPPGEFNFITSTSPEFRVKTGDKFVAETVCLYDMLECKVAFQLDVIDEKGNKETLYGPVFKMYDRYIPEVSIDLSNYAGQKVKFVLTVYNRGNSEENFAAWVQPMIWR